MRLVAVAAVLITSGATLALAQGQPIPECRSYVADVYAYQACAQLMQQKQRDDEAELRAKAAEEERAQLAAQQKAARDREQAKYDAEAAQYARDAAAREAYYDRLPETHAKQIRKLKAHVLFVQQQIARERRIGAMSGFVNAQLLHEAAESIEYDREQIARAYRRYREVGGRKPLSSL